MFKWLKNASEKAQRNNVRRTLSRLIDTVGRCDAILVAGGALSPNQKAKVVSLQQQLLLDLTGLVPLQQLRAEFLEPLEQDPEVSEGVRMAVRHVFDSAEGR